MRIAVHLDLSAIADAELTTVLKKRFKGCGRNIPHYASDLRAIADRLTATLDARGVTPAERRGRAAHYCGASAPSPLANGRLCGALVPVVEFRYADDGRELIVTALVTAARPSPGGDVFALGEFKEPTSVVWTSALSSHHRLN